jgi:hypothetical protein
MSDVMHQCRTVELDQGCPVCLKPAHGEFVAGDGHKRRSVRCENCGTFIITDLVERRLAADPQQRAQAAIALSLFRERAPGETPVVRLGPAPQDIIVVPRSTEATGGDA